MFEPFIIIGCIFFFIVLTYSFQMRNRLHKDYATSCDVLYIPKKEKMLVIDKKDGIEFKFDDSYFLY